MKIAVTGGSGFLGRALIKEALQRDIEVVSFQRYRASDSEKTQSFILEEMDHFECDRLKGFECVIHTAALVHRPNLPEDDYVRLNNQAAVTFFNKCCEAGVKKFIFISTVAVYGVSHSSQKITSATAPDPKTPYAHSKLAAENYFLQKNDAGIEVSILRFPLIYGDHAPGNYGLIAKIAQYPLPLPFANVTNKRSMISVINAAKIILDIVVGKVIATGVHLVCEKEPFSLADLIGKERGHRNIKSLLFPFPIFLMKALLFLGGQRQLYEQIYCDLEFESTLQTSYLNTPSSD